MNVLPPYPSMSFHATATLLRQNPSISRLPKCHVWVKLPNNVRNINNKNAACDSWIPWKKYAHECGPHLVSNPWAAAKYMAKRFKSMWLALPKSVPVTWKGMEGHWWARLSANFQCLTCKTKKSRSAIINAMQGPSFCVTSFIGQKVCPRVGKCPILEGLSNGIDRLLNAVNYISPQRVWWYSNGAFPPLLVDPRRDPTNM